MTENKLSNEQQATLLATLKSRFEKNADRHPTLAWADIQVKLEGDTEKLWSLYEMEQTGGEPDVVWYDNKADKYSFCDCAPESPKGRRSLCYDREALESRKKNKPDNSVTDLAALMGIELLTESEYRALQELGSFDQKTSSWIQTPEDIRAKGGALFCDYRFGHVFVYHNGAESYYSARGFRGKLTL
ncbi:Protein of unknown function [Amphibacillus marinus]|uniref:DUF4256 domain-containing protein n=1 Tax=Amphibacillus marinus TaxID=872970 RepID=A0A1H8KGY0_9BACI|nr:DUF4256 domain-containing protein [Amphibacillus marinus]SEN92219.1 Protein of unknown function [Amphibacillus marinus]